MPDLDVEQTIGNAKVLPQNSPSEWQAIKGPKATEDCVVHLFVCLDRFYSSLSCPSYITASPHLSGKVCRCFWKCRGGI